MSGQSAESGFALVESVFATLVVGVMLLGVGGAFVASMHATNQARQTNHATRFAEQTLASLDEQDAANLLAMDGNIIKGAANTTAAQFQAEIHVVETSVDMLRYTVIFRNQSTGRQIARMISFRNKS